MTTTARPTSEHRGSEPALRLDGSPTPRVLGTTDQVAFWGNLGFSLLGPITALYLVQAPDGSALPLWWAFVALCVGSLVGSALVALAAVPGTETGAPAMVLLRGLLGRRLSYLPTALNLAQCVGWAVFELVVIAQAASQLLPLGDARWPYVLVGGVLTTAMAIRPIGSVRILRRIALVAVVLAAGWLLVQLLRQPDAPSPTADAPTAGVRQFFSGVDVVIALSVSWVPLAADYTRHARSTRSTVVGTVLGYGVAQIASIGVGLLAYATLADPASADPQSALFGSFIALPLGWLAFAVLVVRELDQSFANVYSTTASAQNLLPRVDRRLLSLLIGGVATAAALVVPIAQYQDFLLLIGAVFVPLLAVLAIDYFLLGGRGHWALGEDAPTRAWLLLPWLLGVAAYELVSPTAIGSFSTWLHGGLAGDLLDLSGGWAVLTTSASATSFVLAALVTLALGRLTRRRTPAAG